MVGLCITSRIRYESREWLGLALPLESGVKVGNGLWLALPLESGVKVGNDWWFALPLESCVKVGNGCGLHYLWNQV